MRNLPPPSANFPNPIRKLAAVVATVAAISLAFMFSVVVISIVLVVGTIAWGYLWWKTRELRKQMRNFPPPNMQMENEVFRDEESKGVVIEGEVIRVDETPKVK
jgi:uncharacterized protein YneF (UPF0154 family)